MIKLAFYTAVALSLLSPGHALAHVSCSGQVVGIEQRNDGLVIADWGFGPVRVCYLDASTAMPSMAVSPGACSAFYAMLLTAQAAARPITSYHALSNTCAQALPSSGNDHFPAEQPYGYRVGN